MARIVNMVKVFEKLNPTRKTPRWYSGIKKTLIHKVDGQIVPLYIENSKARDYARALKITPLSGKIFQEVYDVGLRLARVKDKIIRETVYKQIESAKKSKIHFDTEFALDLLDVYHSSKGHYSVLGGYAQGFFKYLKKEVSTQKAKNITADFGFFDKYNNSKQSFEKAKKLESLKSFCFGYGKTKPETTSYVYEKYYLPKLGPTAKEFCKKISDEFGTKVFLEHDKNDKAAKAIYRELCEWKRAGGEEAKFPNLFDCSKIKPIYINQNFTAGGFFTSAKGNMNHTLISVKGDDTKSIERGLRHEMTHLNDKKYIDKNGKMIKGHFKARQGEKPYAAELENAGLNPSFIEYAYANKREFIAYASMADSSKYSEHFKKVLTRLGMPEWQLEMTPIKDMNYFGQ